MTKTFEKDTFHRYSRQTVLDCIGRRGQQQLLAAKVTLIGCGALGTHIADYLVRAGTGTLQVVDRDLVELNNLQRQSLFDEGDVGSPKVIAAVGKLEKINSEVTVIPLIKDLNSANIEGIIAGSDLVVDGTDNVPVRMLINDACVKAGIPWIYGGVIRTRGMTMNILPGGACFRCLMPEPPVPGATPTCETVGVLNTIPALIAALQVTEAVKILLNKEPEKRLIIYESWPHGFQALTIKQSPQCDCCVKGNFTYLDAGSREVVTTLCDNGVQIIPPHPLALDLPRLAQHLRNSLNSVIAAEHILKFTAEGKGVTLFTDGRAIIKGTGDKGAAKALYTRYLGI